MQRCNYPCNWFPVWNQRKKKQKRETSRSQPPAKDLDDGTDCSLDSGVSIEGSSSKLLRDTHNIPEAEKQKKKKFKRTIKVPFVISR